MVADSGSCIMRPKGIARKSAASTAIEKSIKVLSFMSTDESYMYSLMRLISFLIFNYS